MRNCLITVAMIAILVLSTQVSADETVHCAFGEQERVISVAYERQDQPVPCEVRYEKSEGTEILWSAQNEEGFCEARAEEFVEQHRDWGWRCDTADDSEELESMSDVQTDDY